KVTGGSFRGNRAIGGDDSLSPSHNGHALGGAIVSGSLGAVAMLGTGTLEVTGAVFTANAAFGGDDNRVTLAKNLVPPADAPNSAYGGALAVVQGSALVKNSVLTFNSAVGGAGGGAPEGSSSAVGGAIFFYNFIGGVTGAVEGSVISGNQAVGGNGRTSRHGLNGGDGGDALGGGIATGGLGGAFAAPGTVTVTTTQLTSNRARGGAGGRNADGGDAYGGGVYNGADTSLTLSGGLVRFNKADGGKRGKGGSDGDGIGGGVYNTGPFTMVNAVIGRNATSTRTFQITGGGFVPMGLSLNPGVQVPHTITAGTATYLGNHTGAGTFELIGFTSPTTGDFRSGTPFVFTAANGDKLAFNYGRTDKGAAGPGKFTLYPAADGKVVAVFIAELTPDRAASTGRFAKVTGGSFIMVATSAPFSPVPNAEGFTEPFNYSWSGEGTLTFGR
ncbi:MAG: hypothetical protein ACRC33_18530, partial [Gemmataceae bacterium]